MIDNTHWKEKPKTILKRLIKEHPNFKFIHVKLFFFEKLLILDYENMIEGMYILFLW